LLMLVVNGMPARRPVPVPPVPVTTPVAALKSTPVKLMELRTSLDAHGGETG
jgi:hypothetical protein